MISKEELLSTLIAWGAVTEYVTVKELLKNPIFRRMRAKSLGIRLLRLRRQGLVEKKKFGKAYGYKLTRKGLNRHDYFYEKRKREAEAQEFKTRLDKSYNQLLLLKALEEKKENEKRDLIEIVKLITDRD